jgi:hypothetical protein
VGAFNSPGGFNIATTKLTPNNGVLSGTSALAAGAAANADKLDSVLGRLIKLDGQGCKAVRMQLDICPVGGNTAPRVDNHALSVA